VKKYLGTKRSKYLTEFDIHTKCDVQFFNDILPT